MSRQAQVAAGGRLVVGRQHGCVDNDTQSSLSGKLGLVVSPSHADHAGRCGTKNTEGRGARVYRRLVCGTVPKGVLRAGYRGGAQTGIERVAFSPPRT